MKKKQITFKHAGVYLIVIFVLHALCFLLCFVELIPTADTILNTCNVLLLFTSLVLSGIFLKRLWQWLRPVKTLLVTRWIVISSGLALYGAVIYLSLVTLIILALSGNYLSYVDCPKYNVSIYLYDTSFLEGQVTVKVQRGNSIFLEKLGSYSTEKSGTGSTLFHEENYVGVTNTDRPAIIYLDQPPIKK